MKRHWSVLIRVVLLGVAAALALAALSWVAFQRSIERSIDKAIDRIKVRQDRLLNETDHHRLLAGCREVLSRTGEYRANPAVHPGNRRTYPDPDDPRMPAVVRDLHANYVSVDERSVSIELGGGHYHYGVLAYRADTREDASHYLPNARRLIPGLWYYEDSALRPPSRQD